MNYESYKRDLAVRILRRIFRGEAEQNFLNSQNARTELVVKVLDEFLPTDDSPNRGRKTTIASTKVYLVWRRDDCDHGRDRLYGIYRDKDEAISYAKDKVWRHATPEVFPPDSDQYNDAKHYCNGNHLIVAVGHDGFWSITVEETPLK